MEELYYPDTPDAIDGLIATLNAVTVTQGLAFERDVLDVDRPEDWGAMEMTGVENEYADGVIIDQAYRLDIWASVSDRRGDWLQIIEGVLASYGHRLEYQLIERNYMHNLHKVVWRWKALLWG